MNYATWVCVFTQFYEWNLFVRLLPFCKVIEPKVNFLGLIETCEEKERENINEAMEMDVKKNSEISMQLRRRKWC